MFNAFATGHELAFGNNASGLPGWQLEQDLFQPGAQGQDTTAFIGHLMDDLGAKRREANFTVTFCDFWGRAVSLVHLNGYSDVELTKTVIVSVPLSSRNAAWNVCVEHDGGQSRSVADILFRDESVSSAACWSSSHLMITPGPLGRTIPYRIPLSSSTSTPRTRMVFHSEATAPSLSKQSYTSCLQ